jgi:hypothetical protein
MTGLNSQQKVAGREKDSRETERDRERKRERGRVWLRIGSGVGYKTGG